MSGKSKRPRATDETPRMEWALSAQIRSDTINMLMLLATPVKVVGNLRQELEERTAVIGQIPYTGNVHPAEFFNRVGIIVQTASQTIANTHRVNCGIAQEQIQKCCEAIIRDMAQKLKSCVLDPKTGKRMLKTEPDGAVMVATPDEVEVDGQTDDNTGSGMLKLPEELQAAMDEAVKPVPTEDDEDEGEAFQGDDDPKAEGAPGQGKLIIP